MIGEIHSVFYPIGSIYMSINDVNPSIFFGGTWERFANGKVLVGVNERDEDFNVVQKTGGEKAHKLTVDEMPNHGHSQAVNNRNVNGYTPTNMGYTYKKGETVGYSIDSTVVCEENVKGYIHSTLSETQGASQTHNNLQPYVTCFIWVRTA